MKSVQHMFVSQVYKLNANNELCLVEESEVDDIHQVFETAAQTVTAQLYEMFTEPPTSTTPPTFA
ncbi:hypothetical protein LPJ62_005897, partial [Coemansia sp. RSA 2167]